MAEKEISVPELRWIVNRFTKLDEVLKYLAEVHDREADLLKQIRDAIVPSEIPPLGVVDIGDKSVKALAQAIAARLFQLPNRIDDVEINTSTTTWVSLQKTGKIKPSVALGFLIENVGGGFNYKIVRSGFESPQKSAVKDYKWDQEFDDLMIKASGTAGTGKIFVWWRDPIITEKE